jgi:hypothetical protein
MNAEGASGQDEAAPKARQTRLFASADEGTKAVREDFLYWTGKLTESSLQMSFAVIAANWAVFGSVQQVMNNFWAKASLSVVVTSVALSLVGAKHMGELHRRRAEYAVEDSERWEKEYAATLDGSEPWPFTNWIQLIGRVLRELKTWLPLVGGALFIIALLCGQHSQPRSSGGSAAVEQGVAAAAPRR